MTRRRLPADLPTDPTGRFTDRVADYVRFRPRYPRELIALLAHRTGLRPGWTVADLGSGPGFSTEPFLENGNAIYAVEPNAAMRRAAERRLGGRPGFSSVDGRAEATGLEPESVDIAVAGQAFHWFDRARTRTELERILRPPRPVALFWNTRLIEADPFERDYEALLRRFGTDYESVRHDRIQDETLTELYSGSFRHDALPHEQRFDYAGLEGRVRSSSYTPPPGHADHGPMLEALRALFDRHARDGQVVMRYRTDVYTGLLA